jgi:hypothetical protein
MTELVRTPTAARSHAVSWRCPWADPRPLRRSHSPGDRSTGRPLPVLLLEALARAAALALSCRLGQATHLRPISAARCESGSGPHRKRSAGGRGALCVAHRRRASTSACATCSA